MKKKIPVPFLFLLPFFLIYFTLFACKMESPHGPSIILISLDTLRADKLNTYGFTKYKTSPLLDEFAKEAVSFTNCFVQEPWTLTSHMSLFTGLYPKTHGVNQNTGLSKQHITLAEILKKNGYMTRAFVDGGYLNKKWGFDRGFDTYDDYRGKHFREIIPKVINYINGYDSSDPFFLFIHTYDIHSNGNAPIYKSPKKFRGIFSNDLKSKMKEVMNPKKFNKIWKNRNISETDRKYIHATYSEGIRYTDHKIGQLFEVFKKNNFYDNSIIIITSDHGEGLFDHKLWSHGELYDHTIRVPLFVRLPAKVYAGAKRTSLVELIDIAPTILALIGIEKPKEMEGQSFLNVINKDEGFKQHIFSQRVKNNSDKYAIRSQQYKYIQNRRTDKEFLFDLTEDPEEKVNIVAKDVTTRKRMKEYLDEWINKGSSRKKKNAPKIKQDLKLKKQLRALGYLQ